MEYTGIGKEKEEFVLRKSAEEFFRDGEVIKRLFKLTDRLICDERSLPFHEFTICVFNHAYRICWMFNSQNTSIKQIDAFMTFENNTVRNHSWAVAYALLRLHHKFCPLRDRTRIELNMMLPRYFFDHNYSNFVRGQSLLHPIDFRCSLLEPELVKEEIDFAKAMDYMKVAMDTMVQAVKLQKENKELRKQLEMEKSLRGKAEQVAIEIQQKQDVWENDSFYKAVNIKTILKYVQEGDCNKNDVPAIKLMLLSLCAGEVPKEVIEKIKTLKCGGNVTIYDIKKVENFNPTASKSETNHYHNKE